MNIRISLTLVGALLSATLVLPTFARSAASTATTQGAQDQGGEKKREQGGEKKEGEAPKRDAQKSDGNEEMRIAAQMPLYPFDTCVITNQPLGADSKNFFVDGHLVRTCCSRCETKIKGDPAATLKKIDEGIVRKQKAAYPMEKCPVSGDALGEGAVDVVQGARLVRLCSERCVAEFKKDPETSMKKLETAYIASQKKAYPMTHCVVMGDDALNDDAVDFLYGTRLVRFCCKKCIKEFRASPEKYIAKLDEAAAKKKN
jgi:YHS domain-containing protein